MNRVAVAAGLTAWAGATLALSGVRWFDRLPLVDRLRPFCPSRPAAPTPQSLRDALAPLAAAIGSRAAGWFGVDEDVAVRLERLHAPLDATGFRIRQVGWSSVAFVAASIAVVVLRAPGAVTVLFLCGSPLLVFLVLEQRLARASERWQQRVLHELPVVSEQLAALLSAGYSLGGAMNRVADRGSGECAADLARVCARIRQGLSDAEALREWATRAGVDALDRLVSVLALERETADLGRLLEAEARAVRAEVHRRVVEVMERRAQQVWIPVTVATLVPGVVFLAIPFIDALRLFAGT